MPDTLEDRLSKLEAHYGRDSGAQSDLKHIIRERIADIEASQPIDGKRHIVPAVSKNSTK